MGEIQLAAINLVPRRGRRNIGPNVSLRLDVAGRAGFSPAEIAAIPLCLSLAPAPERTFGLGEAVKVIYDPKVDVLRILLSDAPTRRGPGRNRAQAFLIGKNDLVAFASWGLYAREPSQGRERMKHPSVSPTSDHRRLT